MKNLIIIGARGYGREIYGWLPQCTEYNKEWVVKGFLDSKADALEGFNYPVGVLSSVEDYTIQKDDVFICALGSVEYKKKYISMILEKGGQFINVIHPTAIITNSTTLSIGVILCAYITITSDCTIGDFVTIQSFSAIGHDCKIGKWCHINAYSFMGGFAKLEDEVTLNTRATILPGLSVGKGATVGAGSIVIKKVKPATTVFGNPAKEIRF